MVKNQAVVVMARSEVTWPSSCLLYLDCYVGTLSLLAMILFPASFLIFYGVSYIELRLINVFWIATVILWLCGNAILNFFAILG